SGIGFWTAALPQFLQGFGIPLFFIGSTTIAMALISPKDNAASTGAMNFLRTLAAAFAGAIITTLWAHSDQANHAELAGILNFPESAIASLRQAGLPRDQALAMI